MVNITKLEKPTAAISTKGEPPKRGEGIDPIKEDTRTKEVTKNLTLKIPESAFDDFGRLAMEQCGYRKGSKSEFFLEMLADWKKMQGK